MSTDDERTRGIDFGELDDRLEEHAFPTTADELVAEYGDVELDLPSGTTDLREVFAEYDEEFQSAEDARQAILTMVESDAVGREGYSDRGTVPRESGREEESL